MQNKFMMGSEIKALKKTCCYCGFQYDPTHNHRRPNFVKHEGKLYHEQCLMAMQRVQEYYAGKLTLPTD